MNIFKKARQDTATYEERRDGGTKISLSTQSRGGREFTTRLSIDEIEDLIRGAEQAPK